MAFLTVPGAGSLSFMGGSLKAKPELIQSFEAGRRATRQTPATAEPRAGARLAGGLLPLPEEDGPDRGAGDHQAKGGFTSPASHRRARGPDSLDLGSPKAESARGLPLPARSAAQEPPNGGQHSKTMQKQSSSKKLKILKHQPIKSKLELRLKRVGPKNLLQNTGLYLNLESRQRAGIDNSMADFQMDTSDKFLSPRIDKNSDFSYIQEDRLNHTMAIDPRGNTRFGRQPGSESMEDEEESLQRSALDSLAKSGVSQGPASMPRGHKQFGPFAAAVGSREAQAQEPYLADLQKTKSQQASTSLHRDSPQATSKHIPSKTGNQGEQITLASFLNQTSSGGRSIKGVSDGPSNKVSKFSIKKKVARNKSSSKKEEQIKEKESPEAGLEEKPSLKSGKSGASELQLTLESLHKAASPCQSQTDPGAEPQPPASPPRHDPGPKVAHKPPATLADLRLPDDRAETRPLPGPLKPATVAGLESAKLKKVLQQPLAFEKRPRERCSEVNQNNSAHLNQDNESTMVIGLDSTDVNKSMEICEHLLQAPSRKQTFYNPLTAGRNSQAALDFPSAADCLFLQESPKDDDHERSEATATLQRLLLSNPFAKSLVSSIKDHFSKRKKEEFLTSISHYELLKCIGKGSFGKVHLGVQVLTGHKVALKTISKKQLSQEETGFQKVENEVHLLMKTSALPNSVSLLEVFESKDYFFLVSEYASGGDLATSLKKKGRLTEAEAMPIFGDLLAGLESLHGLLIVHRDLKLENVVLTDSGRALITDLGVSRQLAKGELLKDSCGTPAFEAPETLDIEKGHSGFAADVWSLGVLLYHMIYGKAPFSADRIDDLYSKIAFSELNFPTEPEVDASLKDLLHRLLQKDPERRINISEARTHLWLDQYKSNQGLKYESDSQSRLKANRFATYFVEELGFQRAYINDSLRQKKFNHATACFQTVLKHWRPSGTTN
jgi:serine/threonine protein kinase